MGFLYTLKIEKLQYRALVVIYLISLTVLRYLMAPAALLMSHCCILQEGKLFYWRCIKPAILMILNIYLKCLGNKGRSITIETAKLLYNTNAILQHIGYIVLMGENVE